MSKEDESSRDGEDFEEETLEEILDKKREQTIRENKFIESAPIIEKSSPVLEEIENQPINLERGVSGFALQKEDDENKKEVPYESSEADYEEFTQIKRSSSIQPAPLTRESNTLQTRGSFQKFTPSSDMNFFKQSGIETKKDYDVIQTNEFKETKTHSPFEAQKKAYETNLS